jgi:hypothetical protein
MVVPIGSTNEDTSRDTPILPCVVAKVKGSDAALLLVVNAKRILQNLMKIKLEYSLKQTD